MKSSDVVPRVPIPVGVGHLLPGGNNNEFDHNRIWDNWRRGTMQLTLPEAFEFGDGDLPDETSHRNEYHDNLLGLAPNGKQEPNGVDFWWDGRVRQSETTPGPGFGAEDNCWYANGGELHQRSTPARRPWHEPARPLARELRRTRSNGDSTIRRQDAERAPRAAGTRSQSGDFDPKDECIWFMTPPKAGLGQGRDRGRHGEGGRSARPLRLRCELVGDTELRGLRGRP